MGPLKEWTIVFLCFVVVVCDDVPPRVLKNLFQHLLPRQQLPTTTPSWEAVEKDYDYGLGQLA